MMHSIKTDCMLQHLRLALDRQKMRELNMLKELNDVERDIQALCDLETIEKSQVVDLY